ncbi:MAG TPA: response regulator [Leptolyngbyaceae cyanobacterium]
MESLSSSPNPTQKRILIIEDDYANRMFFTDYLRFCEYGVRALTDGLHWQQHMKDFQPHVLLLDLDLPKITGFELIQQIRADSTWQTLPIVVVSGYAFNADIQRAYALGIQAYLIKPVRLRELAQTIAQVAVSGG